MTKRMTEESGKKINWKKYERKTERGKEETKEERKKGNYERCKENMKKNWTIWKLNGKRRKKLKQ